MNDNGIKACLLVVAFGASVSLIVLASKTINDQAPTALVHVADAVKECAITYRSCCTS